MTTISKKAVKRINDLLADASLYRAVAKLSLKNDNTRDEYWNCQLNEGLAIRALFDEFGIEAPRFSWFTEEKIKELKIRLSDQESERAA